MQHRVPRMNASVTCPVTKLEKALLVICKICMVRFPAFWGMAASSRRLLWASSSSFWASRYTENTSAPRMEVVMPRVVFTTLPPLLVRKSVTTLVALSAFIDSSGNVTPRSAAKAMPPFYQL